MTDPQSPGYPPSGMPAVAAPVPDGEEAAGANLLAIAWQNRWLILLGILLGGAGAWAYLQRAVPRYTSTARIFVERSIPRLLANDPSIGGFSDKHLYTQAELIRSTTVLAAAAESLSDASLETFRTVDSPVGLMREELEVVVGDRDDIINISIELPNATEAAQIVNAIVEAYISKYAEQRRTSVVDVLNILRAEKRNRDAELEERRVALDKFRESHLALAVQTSEDNVVTQLFSALATELNETQIQLLEAKARYGRAEKMLQNPDQLAFLREMAQTDYGNSRNADLEQQIQSVEQNLIAQKAKWGEGYPSVRLMQASLEKLKAQQAEQEEAVVEAYVDSLRQNYELLAQRRDELQRAYDKQFELATEVSRQAAELASLQEAYERTARLCDILDDRIKEVDLSEEVGAMNVSVLEVAAPGYQSYPDRPKMLSIGLAFGAIAGFGLAWLRDFLDNRVKSIDEIGSLLQVPVVGAVPLVSGTRGKDTGRSRGGRIVALEPRSVAAEAVRTLRTSLHFGIAGPESKVFVVTSPAPGDGKSTIASNLAIAMSQADQRVLLIDADMRKPTQHQTFELSKRDGLAAILSGSLPAVEAPIPTGIDSLDLIPCGKRPANPVELLNTDMFTEAIDALSEHYDKIIIDSPPVMLVADSRVISATADCTLLVLRAERSTKRMAVAARDELLKVGTRRLGVVVNATPSQRSDYGYSYRYGAGYGAYGPTVYGYGEESEAEQGGRKRSKASRRETDQEEAYTGVDS